MSITPTTKELITLAVIKKLKTDLEGKIDDTIALAKGDTGEKGIPGRDGKDGVNGRDGIDGKDGVAGQNGLQGVAGRDGLDGKDGINGKDGDIRDLSPDEIRDSLELLEGEDRLRIEAIDKLREELDRLEKLARQSRGSIGGGLSRGVADSLYAPIGSLATVTTDSSLTGDGSVSSPLSIVESDPLSVPKTGGTMTGQLTISPAGVTALRADGNVIIRLGSKLIFDG